MSARGKSRPGWYLWLPVALWMILIFTLSNISIRDERVDLFRFQDKLIHFLEFGVLGLLIVRAVYLGGSRKRSAYWWGICLGVFYGALDELHQYFIPERMVELNDLAADWLGVFLAAWVYLAARGEKIFRQER